MSTTDNQEGGRPITGYTSGNIKCQVFSVGIFAHSRHLYNSPSFYDVLHTEKRAQERLTSHLAWFSCAAVYLRHGLRYCLGYCCDMRTEVNGNIGHPSLYRSFRYISLPSLHAQLRLENTSFHFLWRTGPQDNNFLFFPWTLIQSFRIQLKKKLTTFDELNEMECAQ